MKRAASLLLVGLGLVLVACSGEVPPAADGGNADDHDLSVLDASGEDATLDGPGSDVNAPLPTPPRTTAATISLHLQHGAQAATAADPPNAMAYLPVGLVVGVSLDVVVHVHGFYNCIETTLSDADAACTNGGPVRAAHHLASQFESAGRNAILLLPEVLPAARDAASADVGALDDADGLRLFLDEALDALQAELGRRPALGKLIVQVHSGGYVAAAAFAQAGGVAISELYLLDGLYGLESSFDDWMKLDLSTFVGSAPARRYANVYTSVGGTLTNSQAQATTVAGFAPSGSVRDDRTTSTWGDADYRHGLLFKRSALDHDGVVRYYVEQLLKTSSLSAK